MDVGSWLRGLGLGQYETAFRENAVDGTVLPELTTDDLRDLGVNAIGDRRKLLVAIAALRSGSGAPAPQQPQAQRSSRDTAERRPITVMFCDLVGSTSLSAKLDAEDWRDLVNGYLEGASKAVTQHGGHVLKKLGDGIMALFGYPKAQENDAERAVRAGLAILRALDELNARNAALGLPALTARVGLETGPVVVEATGEVFGDAPNVAARVQSAAEPGTLWVTAAVQRQVAGLFVAEGKGPHELKGVPGKPTLYCLVRASGGGRRTGARSLTPLVGRDEELATLARRWERARAGDGQFVQIVGEPGLGKSRLLEEFHTRLGETPHTWVERASSQLLQNTPLHPLTEWGRQRFTSADRLAELEATLAQVKLDPAEYAPLLSPLLDIPVPIERVPLFAAEDLRRKQLAAIIALLLAGARTQPIVLAFEDLHWADPTTLDLMKTMSERGSQSTLLIVATSRPEFRAPWTTRSHHSVISLAPLDRSQIGEMVGAIAERHAMSKEAIESVTNRTAGVPLFIEEVTRLLLEGGAQTIPPTLQQSLAARLDRLGEAREVAQIGAVLGREFSYALLEAVADRPLAELDVALEKLADADLLFAEGIAPLSTYRFKHALIQDAAYESLLKARRQELHRRSAQSLVAGSDTQPELVAHHFTQSGNTEAAIEWWGKAGDAALRRSAFQEAIAHLGKAIEMADTQAAKETNPHERRQLHVSYGNALIAARGYGAPETIDAFIRARQSTVDDVTAPQRLAADYGLWAASYVRGDLAAMWAHAANFLRDSETSLGLPGAGVALRALGATHLFAGEYAEARDCLEQALAQFKSGRDDDPAFLFGHDVGVGVMFLLAIALWPLGEIERAISLVGGARQRTANFTHVATRAYASMHTTIFKLMIGDRVRADPNAAELAQLACEHDLPMWRAYGYFFEGLARSQSEAPSGPLEQMRRGVKLLGEQNVLLFDGLIKIALAQAEARADDLESAIAELDEALAKSERMGHRAFEAELHRARGEMLLRRDPANPAPAELALQSAVAIAKRQGTRTYELLAALALAKLFQSTGRRVEAYDVLVVALKDFTPTPELPALAEAQALLEVLATNPGVKDDTGARQARTVLHGNYAKAMLFAKGFAAPETRVALVRARESAGDSAIAQRFEAQFGEWVVEIFGGDLSLAETIARTFLQDAEASALAVETYVGLRMVGVTEMLGGHYCQAREHLVRAIDAWQPNCEAQERLRFAYEHVATAKSYLAIIQWHLGELDESDALCEAAIAQAEASRHPATMAIVFSNCALVEMLWGRIGSARRRWETLLAHSQEHGMPIYSSVAQLNLTWARARQSLTRTTVDEHRAAVESYRANHGIAVLLPLRIGALAELLAENGDLDEADECVTGALSSAVETGRVAELSFLHRIRGDIFLRRKPSDVAAAEDCFRAALDIAREQGARTFALQAALPLARLLSMRDRGGEACDILSPALEGFAPTPELPEIAEAQNLIAELAVAANSARDAE